MIEYNTVTLPSGLRVIHQLTDSHVGYCGFMVDCGTRHETDPALYGMAHFVEHILFKGTSHRDAWHINQRMESVGGELNAFTTKEDTTFYSTFLAKDFPRACELLCDLIFHATAPQAELEKEREVVIDEIESYRDNPAELIYDVFEDRLFADTPLGHNILGTEETVRSFDHNRCMEFIARNYTPNRLVFFAYGPMPWSRVLRELQKHLSADDRVAPPTLEPLKPFEPLEPKESTESYHQSHCMIGCRTYPIGHPNAAALSIINNLLGGPGMNSRLNQQLREKRGLVYTVGSSVTNYTDTGYFSIYFGCDHADRNHCLQLCRKELQRLIDQPLSPRQLQAAKEQIKGQVGISTANLENNALDLAKHLLRRGCPPDILQTYARLDAVTSEQIQQVASELFTDERLVTVVL